MTSPVLSRQEVEDMLPFWVNGTLDPAEKAQVDAALACDAELRAQSDALGRLRTTIQNTPEQASPGAFGLARLQRAIDREARQNRQEWRPKMAVAAVAALVAAVGAFFLWPASGPTGDTYQQAAGEIANGQLRVTFRPEATEAAMAGLLQQYGLVIVDGPSALGTYQLDLREDGALPQIVSALRAETGVIDTVEFTK
jgi:anti-sigma factor RsiW